MQQISIKRSIVLSIFLTFIFTAFTLQASSALEPSVSFAKAKDPTDNEYTGDYKHKDEDKCVSKAIEKAYKAAQDACEAYCKPNSMKSFESSEIDSDDVTPEPVQGSDKFYCEATTTCTKCECHDNGMPEEGLGSESDPIDPRIYDLF
ncbi:MAG: hypothetical protein H6619_03290 [Deltaproteobacteria bacterium]|nr:hypothetical protein [Deltaproteobacteria bacterium]